MINWFVWKVNLLFYKPVAFNKRTRRNPLHASRANLPHSAYGLTHRYKLLKNSDVLCTVYNNNSNM